MGEKPTVAASGTAEEEARVVGDEIEAAQRGGRSLDDIAILVRASFQMRAFEERFIALGMPYKVIGGPRFYERAEIRDALAYLRCVAPARRRPRLRAHRQHAQARPRRGDAAGSCTTSRGARAFADARRARADRDRRAEAAAARSSLRELLRDFRPLAGSGRGDCRTTSWPSSMLEESGYTDMWKADARRTPGPARQPQGAGPLDGRVPRPRRLPRTRLAGHGVESADGGDARLDHDAARAPRGWSSTWCSCPAGRRACFPHQRSLDENGRAGLEEERRLAYVGLTRARRRGEHLSRRQPARARPVADFLPSRFIDELPPDHVEVEETASGVAPSAVTCVSRFDACRCSVRATRRRARGGRRPGRVARTLRPASGEAPGVNSKGARSRFPPLKPFGKARASSTSNSAREAWSPRMARSSPSISTAPAASW